MAGVWRSGELQEVPDSGIPVRLGIPGQSGLHCGERLEIKVGGCWHRGRVEYGGQFGWYWTDNDSKVPLLPGIKARVWHDRDDWPREERRRGLER
jgi:hypothetical protein